MQPHDSNLDDEMRAVPLPDHLVQRLRQIAVADDAGLDQALREMPLPGGLLARLRSLPLADDAALDEALRDVPVPAGLIETCQRRGKDQPQPRRPAARSGREAQSWVGRISRLALAVSVLAIVGLSSYYLALEVQRQKQIAVGPPITPAERLPAPADALAVSPAYPEASTPRETAPAVQPPHVALERIDEKPAAGHGPDLAVLAVPPGADPLLNAALYRWPGTLGSPAFDNLPEPKVADDLAPHGINWLVGASRAFLIRHGFHPFVSPTAQPQLRSMLVPLDTGTRSYDLLRQSLRDQGRLPPAEQMRTEEILAALDYQFPAPNKQALGLIMSGGPSPFAGEGTWLLQIGVQARQLPDEDRPPVRAIVVVDTSASMRRGDRMEMVRRALRDLARRLAPDDRLSLVAFGENARLLIQDAGRQDADEFVAAVEALAVENSTNVGAGLRQAYAMAQQDTPGNSPPVHVWLLTDGLVKLDDASAAQIEERLADAAARGVRLDVIQVGHEKVDDPQLAAMAQAGRGVVHRAAGADQIGRILRELFTGRSQLVARDARLKLTFNPQVVQEYRLLGHEAKGVAGLLADRAEADFQEGQSATAMYEVLLVPGATGEVAAAGLTWYAPGGSVPRSEKSRQTATQKIGTGQFAARFQDAPLWLQEAALAAHTAEALRKLPLARMPRTGEPRPLVPAEVAAALNRVRDTAMKLDSRLRQRPSFVEFVSLVTQAAKAKPAPKGP